MNFIQDVIYSHSDLERVNTKVLYIYAKMNGIKTDIPVHDLRWLVAIDIMSKTLNDSTIQIAYMKSALDMDARLKIMADIRDNQISIHQCDMSKYIKNRGPNNKSGTSKAELIKVVIEALGNYHEAIIKLIPLPTKPLYDNHQPTIHHISLRDNILFNFLLAGIVYEALIYKYFVTYMLEKHITPNLPEYYGYISCDEQKYYSYDWGNKAHFGLLFIESMDGQQFFNIGYSLKSISAWRAILFQILYTLHCLHLFHIYHNDLHTSNIFIENDKTGEITYYTDSSTYYTVPISDGFVKIFDFDLSAVNCDEMYNDPNISLDIKNLMSDFDRELKTIIPETSFACANEKIPTYEKYGILQNNVPEFDMYMLFCFIWNLRDIPMEIKNFITDIYGDKKILDYKNPPGGFPCHVPMLRGPQQRACETYNTRSGCEANRDPFGVYLHRCEWTADSAAESAAEHIDIPVGTILYDDDGPIFEEDEIREYISRNISAGTCKSHQKSIPDILKMPFFDPFRNNGLVSSQKFHFPNVII